MTAADTLVAMGGRSAVQTIGYDELIAPLVKAIQELTDRVKIIESNK